MATPISSPAPVDQESFIQADTRNDRVTSVNEGVATVDITQAPPRPIPDPLGDFIAGLDNRAPVTEARIVQVNKPAGDWRARLQLAPASDYLYNAPDAASGILAPLKETNGVIFPYTPSIDTIYHANYAEVQLTHSNWAGYHYNGSKPGVIQLQAKFTAQDNKEAAYMLACIHFFRSATKMFYGQDYERGAPPPVLFLSAFGEHQYNRTPVVIQDFNYILPADVNYVRTKPGTIASTAAAAQFISRQTNPITATLARLQQIGVLKGGSKQPSFARQTSTVTEGETSYVPAMIDVTLSLIPIPNRQQISNEFSLRDYASGALVTKGFI